MKISEISPEFVREYLRAEYDNDNSLEFIIMPAVKNFISSYTGLSFEKMDGVESLSIAFLILCAEMYDNRAFTVEKAVVNPTVQMILDMYSTNLL